MIWGWAIFSGHAPKLTTCHLNKETKRYSSWWHTDLKETNGKVKHTRSFKTMKFKKGDTVIQLEERDTEHPTNSNIQILGTSSTRAAAHQMFPNRCISQSYRKHLTLVTQMQNWLTNGAVHAGTHACTSLHLCPAIPEAMRIHSPHHCTTALHQREHGRAISDHDLHNFQMLYPPTPLA